MPLLTALIGVGIGVTSITTLTGFVDLGSTTPILATMLGLAVGIDYALFIVSRYRHEVQTGRSFEEAAGRAVGTAGSAVIFAGLTVIIALAGLTVVNISFLTEMGLAAAGTVAVAVLIALTMLPALFGFAGQRIQGHLRFLKVRDPEARDGKITTGRRWAQFVTKHKAVTFVSGLVDAARAARRRHRP
jgi:RND superfamily putative drug exporter